MKVFLSHSSKDKRFVRKLKNDLEHAGISVWIDDFELRVGENISAIQSAIGESKYFVIVMSVAASKSTWVEREIELAKEVRDVEILPLLLEDIPGGWKGALADRGHADFRTPSEYRRSLYRLISAISGRPTPSFLLAKEAAVKVKTEINPSGELFGVSQQGVATLYSLIDPRDWVFADATSGTSQFWIVEFFDPRRACVQPYAVFNDSIHELPVLFLLDSDRQPARDSVIVYTCVLNELFCVPEHEAESLIKRSEPNVGQVSKRYTRFRPALIRGGEFVDSDIAVSRAIECGRERGVLRSENKDIFVLMKLECDKRAGDLLTWTVSFFDPTLLESVLTVGVDALTGVVSNPSMPSELLNAKFFHLKPKLENGKIEIGLGHQLRAMERRVWDIPLYGEAPTSGLTAKEAMELSDALLSSSSTQQWELAFLSNTGVVASITSPQISSAQEGLMKPDGTAGQWVIEVYTGEPRVVYDELKKGYAYDFKQILVTRKEGAVLTGSILTCAFTVPLSRCPLPPRLMDAYAKARMLAIGSVMIDFSVMSVALVRREGEAAWCFRFYTSEDQVMVLGISGDGMRVIG